MNLCWHFTGLVRIPHSLSYVDCSYVPICSVFLILSTLPPPPPSYPTPSKLDELYLGVGLPYSDHAFTSGICFQVFLCQAENKEKAKAAIIDVTLKEAELTQAQERANATQEAVNDKLRELLKTTRNDTLKVLCAMTQRCCGVLECSRRG